MKESVTRRLSGTMAFAALLTRCAAPIALALAFIPAAQP
jgi:hypothetical protein